jgi:hypothetical protein
MGEVVAFQPRERTPRPPNAPPAGDAQILFFLGVRYMRMEETPDPVGAHTPGPGPCGGKKRKGRARA